ncbi:hypothetical protein BIU90_11230 [Curtobacterium sp. MCBA15_001]|nr:hypothetical protein BIU90_11230 [Curtobacterium sp. MCBA15_001]
MAIALSGRDTDAAIASIGGLYAGRSWYSSAVDEDYWFRYVGVGDAQLSIRRSQLHGYLRGEMATESDIVVHWLDRGNARVDLGKDETRMEPGVPTLFPVDRLFRVAARDWDQRLVHIGRDLLHDVALEQGLGTDVIQFQDAGGVDAAGAALWRRSVSSAMQVLQTAGATSLAWHDARRELVRTFLRLYPLRDQPTPVRSGMRSDRRLRLAVAFIEAHADQPLTVTLIASASDFSIRGLQDAFQRTYDQTPTAYLRETRLRRTREQLLLTHPGESSIAEVARAWGFTHLGRFAAEYKSLFGEYPKTTLRSRR